MTVTVHDDGIWSSDEDTFLIVRAQAEPFHHRDRNGLRKIAEPTPNPMARGACYIRAGVATGFR